MSHNKDLHELHFGCSNFPKILLIKKILSWTAINSPSLLKKIDKHFQI